MAASLSPEKLQWYNQDMSKINNISLVDGEKVELRIRRAVVGIIAIWAGVLAGSAALILILSLDVLPADFGGIIMIIVAFLLLVGIVATYVYRQNELVVTNKRVIHRAMISPFGESLNAIDLSMVEDVSLRREGIWQYIFRVGTIRMSTVGDETTYTFKFVSTPEDEIDLISKLVHADQNRGKKKSTK